MSSDYREIKQNIRDEFTSISFGRTEKERKRYNLAKEIALKELCEMKADDIVRYFMEHRMSKLSSESLEDLIYIKSNFKKHESKNEYCKSCKVEVTATCSKECPLCGEEI